MKVANELRTDRLRLRTYHEADIPSLVKLLDTPEIAATTLRIAHPYTEADARAFLAAQTSPAAKFGIFTLSPDGLVGGIGLSVDKEHQRAELGYWVGVPYWGQGYCTEAARELVRFGFEELGLHRIYASYFSGNVASQKVLERSGMKYEGRSREHINKCGKFIDVENYALLADEWRALKR